MNDMSRRMLPQSTVGGPNGGGNGPAKRRRPNYHPAGRTSRATATCAPVRSACSISAPPRSPA